MDDQERKEYDQRMIEYQLLRNPDPRQAPTLYRVTLQTGKLTRAFAVLALSRSDAVCRLRVARPEWNDDPIIEIEKTDGTVAVS